MPILQYRDVVSDIESDLPILDTFNFHIFSIFPYVNYSLFQISLLRYFR